MGNIVPNIGTGFGPGIPRDSQYTKFHVKNLQFESIYTAVPNGESSLAASELPHPIESW